MNAFLGKCQFVSVCLFLGVYALAKAQSTTTVPQSKEYVITAQADRASLFKIINELKNAHEIQTTFKNYKLGSSRLINLELEFTTAAGSGTVLKADNSYGIAAQSIVVDLESNQIVYAGIKSGWSTASNPVGLSPTSYQSGSIAYANDSKSITSNSIEEMQSVVEKPRERAGKTFSVRSPKVTDPMALDVSQIDRIGPDETAAIKEKNADAFKQKQELQAQQLKEEKVKRKADANAVKQQSVAELKRENASLEAKRQLEFEIKLESQKELADKKAKESAEKQTQMKAEALRTQEKLDTQKELAERKKAAEQKSMELKVLKDVKHEFDSIENDLVMRKKTTKESNNMLSNDKLNKKSTAADMQAKAEIAAAQDDKESMKQTMIELRRIQEKESKKESKDECLKKGFVFINAQQYIYEVYKNRTLIFDSMERNVLVIPAELDELPVSGVISLNGLGCHFSFRNYVITLKNIADELVDLQGKAL
jgi:chemotaxis protein histidine kinase CheA